MSQKYEVVISGISGRFPETDSVNEYKKMLYESISPITYDNRKWPAGYRYKRKYVNNFSIEKESCFQCLSDYKKESFGKN